MITSRDSVSAGQPANDAAPIAVRKARPRLRRWGAYLCATAVLAVTLVATPAFVPTPQLVSVAEAASASSFDPGNIISDAVFFDDSALTSTQIQAFLKAQVPKCKKDADGPDCLKSYRQNTPTIPKDSFCKAYKGAKNESAAKMIAKVAKSCDISAKVLLVLLQKEQSLVTSVTPTDYKYLKATGFACPDTAPCNPKYGGFFYQVYYAGRQYQRYANDPAYSWRKVGKNRLPYHPSSMNKTNPPCGMVDVNIKNQATLGLYFYTPYVPNAAALAAGYGIPATGPNAKCASYGNRNFWALFNDWWGSTRYAVSGPISQAWTARGSQRGSMGMPKASATCDANGQCAQKFAKGYLAWTSKYGSFPVTGAAATAWVRSGGIKGVLKFPRANAKCDAKGQCTQRFTGGYLVWTAKKSPIIVTGKIATQWAKSGGRAGKLGMPTAAAKCSTKTGACTQKFKLGRMAQHKTYGTYAVTKPISTYWVKIKGTKGTLGWPTNVGKCTTKSQTVKGKRKNVTACVQRFSGGWVVSSNIRKSKIVRGSVAKTWRKKVKKLGNPIASAKCTTSRSKVKTCTQKFEGGTIKQVGSRTSKVTYTKKK